MKKICLMTCHRRSTLKGIRPSTQKLFLKNLRVNSRKLVYRCARVCTMQICAPMSFMEQGLTCYRIYWFIPFEVTDYSSDIIHAKTTVYCIVLLYTQRCLHHKQQQSLILVVQWEHFCCMISMQVVSVACNSTLFHCCRLHAHWSSLLWCRRNDA